MSVQNLSFCFHNILFEASFSSDQVNAVFVFKVILHGNWYVCPVVVYFLLNKLVGT